MDNNTVSNYSFFNVRSSTVLTTSAVAGTVIGGTTASSNLFYNNQLIILANFTIGSLTNVILTVEFSPDNSTWYQETYEDIAVSTGVATVRAKTHVIAGTGKYKLPPITICDSYVRISATGTGTVTNSLLTVDAIVGKI